MQKKKIAIIGTVGLPANYGGFETLAAQLVEGLDNKFDLSVYCSTKKYPKESRLTHYGKARLIYLPFNANGFQSVIYDIISIIHALFYADVLLVLGVPGAVIFPLVRMFTNKKIIVSIDGIEWKRNKWNKLARYFLWASEWVAVRYAHKSIADNESIQDYTAMRYGLLSQIIEYGADHTIKVVPTKDDIKKYPFLKNPYAFKVCRIEPENNIHEVLKAFEDLPKFTLVMVGNWNVNEYAKNLREQYATYPNIILLDPIYNQMELDCLRGNAYVYIHGHSAGGTNPSLVEAMYLGLPIITYDVSYNRTTTEDKALYFKNAHHLQMILKNTPFSKYKNIATDMLDVAIRRYNWKSIITKYEDLVDQSITETAITKLHAEYVEQIANNKLAELGIGHLANTNHFYEKR